MIGLAVAFDAQHESGARWMFNCDVDPKSAVANLSLGPVIEPILNCFADFDFEKRQLEFVESDRDCEAANSLFRANLLVFSGLNAIRYSFHEVENYAKSGFESRRPDHFMLNDLCEKSS